MPPHLQVEVSRLNMLLNCELSASEIYNLAISRIGDDHAEESFALSRLALEHQTQSNLLKDEIRRRGGRAKAGVSDWSPYAKTIAESENLFRDVLALDALRLGELRGLEEYRAVLADDSLDAPTRSLLVDYLVPGKERHIATLEALISRINF